MLRLLLRIGYWRDDDYLEGADNELGRSAFEFPPDWLR